MKRSQIRRKPRPAKETLRIYGPPARREFVADLPCCTCGRIAGDGVETPKNQNSHIITGGAGFKAGFEYIVPQCFDCHHTMTATGILTFLRSKGLTRDDLYREAALVEVLWIAQCEYGRLDPETGKRPRSILEDPAIRIDTP